MQKNRKLYAGIGGLLMVGTMAVAGATTTGALASTSSSVAAPAASLSAMLLPLNNSGGHGHASVEVVGTRAQVSIDAFRLAKGLPHAQHIHFGKSARHECPSARDDKNLDHRLNTTDGLPAYGPIRKSLTTRGDTSPKSALAVNRFPTTPKGQEHYDRSITFNSADVARAIRNGKGVIVIHGVDYNGNGKYDFSSGRSDLDPSLPTEATDPPSAASCADHR